MDFKYHLKDSLRTTRSIDFTTNGEQPKPFETVLEFELQNLDSSIANALRRIVIAEVETVAISEDTDLLETDNITVFNTEFLKDRLVMLPIHFDTVKGFNLFKDKMSKIFFRICDPNDLTKPLINEDDQNRIITCNDIIILEEVELEEQLGEQLGDQPEESQPVGLEGYRILKTGDYFKYGNMFLLELKKGESIYLTMKPSVGLGIKHAKWHGAVIQYEFKSKKQYNDPNYNWKKDETYDPIRDFQDYQLSSNKFYGKYGSPENYKILLEYNGHFRPNLTWLLAIQSLKTKVEFFLENIRQISGKSGQVTETLKVEFSKIPNLVKLILIKEDHTLGNVMFAHYLYNLENLVQIINKDKADEIILSGFSHYKVPYSLDPIQNKLEFMFKTPEWSQSQIQSGFDEYVKNLNNSNTVVNLYDTDFYMKNPTIRLLMIVTERVINMLNELEIEANNILTMATNGQI